MKSHALSPEKKIQSSWRSPPAVNAHEAVTDSLPGKPIQQKQEEGGCGILSLQRTLDSLSGESGQDKHLPQQGENSFGVSSLTSNEANKAKRLPDNAWLEVNQLHRSEKAPNINSASTNDITSIVQKKENRKELLPVEVGNNREKNRPSTPDNRVLQLVPLPPAFRAAIPTQHAIDEKHWVKDVLPLAPKERVRAGPDATIYPREWCDCNLMGKVDKVGLIFSDNVSRGNDWTFTRTITRRNTEGEDIPVEHRYGYEGWHDDVLVKIIVGHKIRENTQAVVTTFPLSGRNARVTWTAADEAAAAGPAKKKLKITTVARQKPEERQKKFEEWLGDIKGGIQAKDGYKVKAGGSGKKTISTILEFNTSDIASLAAASIKADNKPKAFDIASELLA